MACFRTVLGVLYGFSVQGFGFWVSLNPETLNPKTLDPKP